MLIDVCGRDYQLIAVVLHQQQIAQPFAYPFWYPNVHFASFVPLNQKSYSNWLHNRLKQFSSSNTIG